jgi:hypothetical protein
MDSTTFTNSSKDAQLLEYATTGLHGDLLQKLYGQEYVEDVSKSRDLIRDLISKSVESREQAVSLSKKWFGDNAVTVIQMFQQRLAEANKVPKRAKKRAEVVKIDSNKEKVLKVDAGESTVVELVDTKKKSKDEVPAPSSSASASANAKEEKVLPDLKKMKSAPVAKKRKAGESESEA